MKVATMAELTAVWKESLTIDIHEDPKDTHERIITFVHDHLLKNDVNPARIDFMGTVYSKNHISARVPSLVEMAIGRIYQDDDPGGGAQENGASREDALASEFQSWQPPAEKTVDTARYLVMSPQRLNLVDDRSGGLEKMAKAVTAFNGLSALVCWHGELEFEIMLVSSKG